MKKKMTGNQCRGARALLRLTVTALSKKLNMAPGTIFSFENGKTDTRNRTICDIQRYLEKRGVEFSETGGVRLRIRNDR